MSGSEQPDFDVGIIGGGPAGGALGGYLGKAGVKAIIFERELFPRPHVGESLVPSSTRVFKDLDFLPVMEQANFPHKFGAVWTASGVKREFVHGLDGLEANNVADIRFEERAQPGVDQNYTYHVDRGKFDNLLLHHAQKLGAYLGGDESEAARRGNIVFCRTQRADQRHRVAGRLRHTHSAVRSRNERGIAE